MCEKSFDLNNLRKCEDKPFVYERYAVNKEKIHSYKTILQEVTRCLEYLEKYEVTKHVGIAINLKEHSAQSCVLLLGILNYNCHFYCLDFEKTKSVTTYLKLSGVKYVISPQDLQLDIIPKQPCNELKIMKDIFYLYSLEIDNSFIENVRLCYTIATSGSTGEPKMVHVPYECIETNIKSLSHLLNIQENDMIFLGSPPTFDPFVIELFMCLENRAKLLITSKEIRLQPQQLLNILFPRTTTFTQGVTIFQTTPSLFRLFGKQSIQDVILSKNSTLRCLILGGENFPNILELKSWLPLDFHLTHKRIFNIYGITEVSCWSSIYEFDAKTKYMDKDRVPLGTPLDNDTFFRIVDEYGNVLNRVDCKGELEIGSSIRRCFIPQYDTDVKILKSNDIIYRKTGDIIECDSFGNIYYTGRTNNIIKRLGKRMCLDSLNKKVENLLSANNMCYKVISLWHKETSSLILYLVNSKNKLENKKEIINILNKNLDHHEKADKIFYGINLPLNHHGKVDNKKILQQILMTDNSPVKIFKEFLKNVLGLGLDKDIVSEANETPTTSKRLKLSTNLSFTQAGGTSYQALSLATEMAKQMEKSCEQRKILEMLLDNNVTIQDILKFVISCPTKLITNESLYEGLENIKSNINLKLLWRCDLKKCIDATPSIYEEKYVAVGSHSNLLLTVNATTGEEISRLALNDRIECPVVFVNSQLALVGCYDGFLYGFDFNNATVLWKINAKGMIKAKPLIINNMVIIASYAEDHNIKAFNLKSLSLEWSLKLGTKGIFSSPLQITEKSALYCSLDGTYALIQVYKGCIQWRQKLDTPIFSTATKIQTSNEILLVLAEVKGQISVCKAESGERISSFQVEGNIFSGITLFQPDHTNHSFIIFGCHDKNLYCLRIEHESKQLTLFSKYSFNSAVYSTPIVIRESYILACSTKGLLVLMDLQMSSILASYDLKAEVFSTPSCLRDKYIYVGSRDNYIYAFQLEK